MSVIFPIGTPCFNLMDTNAIPTSLPESEWMLATPANGNKVSDKLDDANIGRVKPANDDGPLSPGTIQMPKEEDNGSSLNEPEDKEPILTLKEPKMLNNVVTIAPCRDSAKLFTITNILDGQRSEALLIQKENQRKTFTPSQLPAKEEIMARYVGIKEKAKIIKEEECYKETGLYFLSTPILVDNSPLKTPITNSLLNLNLCNPNQLYELIS